jgi:selenide,water dikinase
VALPAAMPPWRRALLTDPQTSGGLLVACAAAQAGAIRDQIVAAGYPRAQIIGSVAAGEAAIRIT